MLQRYGSLSGQLHMIELEKDPAARGLGISLTGNKEDSRARMSIYVAHVDPQGPAGLDRRIVVGDELLEVGGNVKTSQILMKKSDWMPWRVGEPRSWIMAFLPDQWSNLVRQESPKCHSYHQ